MTMYGGYAMMCFEVILRMNDSNSLCTVGMLSALLEETGEDYLSLVSPFVLRAMPDKAGQEINLSDVQEQLKEHYGFEDMPLEVIKRILNRARKADAYVSFHNGVYSVVRAYPKEKFDTDYNDMRRMIQNVLGKLRDYLADTFGEKKPDEEKAQSMLFSFYQSWGFRMAKSIAKTGDVSDLCDVTEYKDGRDCFRTARFILYAYENKSQTAEQLTQITKGFLVCQALYFFEKDQKNSLTSKLQEVVFYLDCSLVIDALGYDSEESERAIKELLKLIRNNGGSVCVFRHTVDEAYQRKNSFRLTALLRRNYGDSILEAIANSVEENLKKLRIPTVDTPSCTDSRYQLALATLDETKIQNWLEDSRKTSSPNKNYEFDTKSLMSIGLLRKGTHPQKIERCRAMLITQDPWLNRCMREIWAKTNPETFLEKPPEIDYAILDIDLVSLLWLRSYNKKSSLPEEMLLASANAACQLNQNVMNRAIELADELRENDDLPENAALIIRGDPNIRRKLSEVTENDSDSVTPEALKKALDELTKAGVQAGIQDAINKIEIGYKQKLSNKDKQLLDKDYEIKRLKEEKKAEKLKAEEDERRKRKRIDEIAEQKALKAKRGVALLIGMAFFFTCVAWIISIIGNWNNWHNMNWLYVIMEFVLSVASLLQIIDYFRGRRSIAAWVYVKVFTHYHDKGHKELNVNGI